MTDAMRSEFEAEYPPPENAAFNGDVYIAPLPAEGMTAYNVRWDAWKQAWQACAARLVPDGWIKCSERLPAPYQHVVGLWSYANGVTEMEVTMYECDGAWFDSKEPEYWFPFPAAPEGK